MVRHRKIIRRGKAEPPLSTCTRQTGDPERPAASVHRTGGGQQPGVRRREDRKAVTRDLETTWQAPTKRQACRRWKHSPIPGTVTSEKRGLHGIMDSAQVQVKDSPQPHFILFVITVHTLLSSLRSL